MERKVPPDQESPEFRVFEKLIDDYARALKNRRYWSHEVWVKLCEDRWESVKRASGVCEEVKANDP